MTRKLQFRAFIDCKQFAVMLYGVNLHIANEMVGCAYEWFQEELEEKTDWKINDDYQLEHKVSQETIDIDTVNILDSGEDYLFFEKTIVTQFTGLLDKNKKEIYDGDVLKDFSGYNWIVSWNDAHACFQVKSQNAVAEIIDNGNMEVIGNIYENPELLKL